jgi:hypothetical protein
MKRFLAVLSGILIVSLSVASVARADKRVALVIGNSSYQNVARLENPANDATLMAATLRDLGFALIGGDAQLDLDKAKFDSAVQNFGNQLIGADVALFYYAGHGVQVRGANYLVPIGANPRREADVDFQMVDIALVLRQMEGSGTKLNLVILDACRNNPFGGRGLRAVSNGLAQMQAPEGTLISYATQPGNVALDGPDRNSPYTKALAQTIRKAGLDIFQTFNEVGLAVMQATGSAQQPWLSSSPIRGAFYFAGPPAAPVRVTTEPSSSSAGSAEAPKKIVAAPVPLVPPGSSNNPSIAVAPDAMETARLMQSELRRVGCYVDSVDGNWSASSRHALELFNKHAGLRLETKVPTFDALEAVRSKASRICPLVCARGYHADGEVCVANVCPFGFDLKDDGTCQKPSAKPSKGPVQRRSAGAGRPVVGVAPSKAGTTTCGRNGCQIVPAGCHAVRGGGGGGLGGKIVCP